MSGSSTSLPPSACVCATPAFRERCSAPAAFYGGERVRWAPDGTYSRFESWQLVSANQDGRLMAGIVKTRDYAFTDYGKR